MTEPTVWEAELLEKIRRLPPEKIAEVQDFIEFLRTRASEDRLRRSMMGLAEPAFARVWDNDDDAAYDRL